MSTRARQELIACLCYTALWEASSVSSRNHKLKDTCESSFTFYFFYFYSPSIPSHVCSFLFFIFLSPFLLFFFLSSIFLPSSFVYSLFFFLLSLLLLSHLLFLFPVLLPPFPSYFLFLISVQSTVMNKHRQEFLLSPQSIFNLRELFQVTSYTRFGSLSVILFYAKSILLKFWSSFISHALSSILAYTFEQI